MKTLTTAEARKDLDRLLDEVASTSEPIRITGTRTNGILVAADDWRALAETVHLASLPGMAASIREGLATPLAECVEELDW